MNEAAPNPADRYGIGQIDQESYESAEAVYKQLMDDVRDTNAYADLWQPSSRVTIELRYFGNDYGEKIARYLESQAAALIEQSGDDDLNPDQQAFLRQFLGYEVDEQPTIEEMRQVHTVRSSVMPALRHAHNRHIPLRWAREELEAIERGEGPHPDLPNQNALWVLWHRARDPQE